MPIGHQEPPSVSLNHESGCSAQSRALEPRLQRKRRDGRPGDLDLHVSKLQAQAAPVRAQAGGHRSRRHLRAGPRDRAMLSVSRGSDLRRREEQHDWPPDPTSSARQSPPPAAEETAPVTAKSIALIWVRPAACKGCCRRTARAGYGGGPTSRWRPRGLARYRREQPGAAGQEAAGTAANSGYLRGPRLRHTQMAASTGSAERHEDAEQRLLTRADVLSTAEAAELLGIPRSTVHYLARRASCRHAASGAAGCSYATDSRRRSRRSTGPAPRVPRTTTSGPTAASPGSRNLERYSKAPSRRRPRRPETTLRRPNPRPPQALQQAGATGLEPAASGTGGDPASRPHRYGLTARRLDRARLATGLRPLRFRDLRHTYGSLLVARGVDHASVKAAIGHSRTTTERYHARSASEMAERFTRALSPTGAG
jgi:hypothetical protein